MSWAGKLTVDDPVEVLFVFYYIGWLQVDSSPNTKHFQATILADMGLCNIYSDPNEASVPNLVSCPTGQLPEMFTSTSGSTWLVQSSQRSHINNQPMWYLTLFQPTKVPVIVNPIRVGVADP